MTKWELWAKNGVFLSIISSVANDNSDELEKI